jgi:ketosteroid isomerase-like protein
MRGDDSADRNANHEIIATYARAWEAGDAATLVGLYHDEIVLHWFGENPLAGDHTGKPAALAALLKLQQLVNRSVHVHDVLSGPSHAAILASETWEREGRTMTANRALVFHLRDGKLAECWVYDEDQRAVDEFWA